jgi:hypothetical protein
MQRSAIRLCPYIAPLLAAALALVAPAPGAPGTATAESPAAKCASNIRPAPNKYGYRNHGDRCEGEFQQEVGSSLFLVSLTLGPMPRPAAESSSIQLSWLDTQSAPISVTARVLEQHQYYRMDTEPAGGTLGFDWSLGALQSAGLFAKRLAVTAALKAYSDDGSARRYTPVRARYQASLKPESPPSYYSAVFLCGDEVRSVRASLVDVVDGKRSQVWAHRAVSDEKFLPTYPIAVRIPISKLGKGYYIVDVTAETLTDAALTRFEMLHD